MKKNFFYAGFAACLLLLCGSVPTQAGPCEPALQTAFFQSALKAAGVASERIASDSVNGYSGFVYMPDFKGSEVTIGFPSAGLRRGTPFLLAIDGMAALVQYSADGKLAIVGGDRRIAGSGVFDIIECILSNALESVGDLIESIAHLDVAGIIKAVAQLVFGILDCDF